MAAQAPAVIQRAAAPQSKTNGWTKLTEDCLSPEELVRTPACGQCLRRIVDSAAQPSPERGAEKRVIAGITTSDR